MSRLLGSLIVLFAAIGSGLAAEPTTEELVAEYARLSAEATKLIDTVKDKAGAEKAKPGVETVVTGIEKSAAELGKRPVADVRKAFGARKDTDKADFLAAYERLRTRSPE